MNTTPLQGDTAAGHSWPSIGGEYYTPTLRERARERESEKTTNAVEKHASFVFITHKRDLYTRPMRVLSRHDGHQELAHGKSAEQEDLYRPYLVKPVKALFFRGLVSRHDGHRGI